MNAWLFCSSSENGSCNDLGEKRRVLRELANDLQYNVVGFTSLSNDNVSKGIEELNHVAMERKIDILLYESFEVFDSHQKNFIELLDACIRNDIDVENAMDMKQVLDMEQTSSKLVLTGGD